MTISANAPSPAPHGQPFEITDRNGDGRIGGDDMFLAIPDKQDLTVGDLLTPENMAFTPAASYEQAGQHIYNTQIKGVDAARYLWARCTRPAPRT